MREVLWALALAALLVCGRAQAADLSALDGAMAPIAQQLLRIDQALAEDSTQGVQAAAQAIVALSAAVHTAGLEGEDGARLQGLGAKISAAAQDMAAASDLEAQRQALHALSKPIALWASLRQPEGLHVAYCPMAKGSWLQADKKIANPYYGKAMLRCGQVVTRSDS